MTRHRLSRAFRAAPERARRGEIWRVGRSLLQGGAAIVIAITLACASHARLDTASPGDASKSTLSALKTLDACIVASNTGNKPSGSLLPFQPKLYSTVVRPGRPQPVLAGVGIQSPAARTCPRLGRLGLIGSVELRI